MSNPFLLPGRFWRGNLHTHSTRSDGKLTVDVVCQLYAQAGYDFLSLTDHFLPEYDFPLTDTTAYRTDRFTTIIGAEIHTRGMELGNAWHIVAVGLPTDFAHTRAEETGPELAQRALQAGAFVSAAHPQWFAMTENDMLSLGDIHAIEIYNAGCADDNDSAESAYMLDLMLARGKRYNATATDDAHFVPTTRDFARGWVNVKSQQLTPEALLSALKAGDYYSSTGPEIYDIRIVPGESLSVICSPVSHIFAIGLPYESKALRGQGLMQADFDLRGWRSPYVRVTLRDENNLKAWSNPIWL